MGLVDVIFTNMPYDFPYEFECIKVMDLHDCLVANKDYDYLKGKKITKKELENLPLLVIFYMLTKEHVKKELESNELFELNIELPLKEKYLAMVLDSSRENNIIIKTFTNFIKKS